MMMFERRLQLSALAALLLAAPIARAEDAAPPAGAAPATTPAAGTPASTTTTTTTTTTTSEAKTMTLAQQAAEAAVKAADAATAAAAAAKAAAEAARLVAAQLPSSAATPPAPVAPAAKPSEVKVEVKVVEKVVEKTPEKPAEKPPEPPKKQMWFGTIGINLISITGNADSLTASGLVAVERRGEEWIIGIKTEGKYGQARPDLSKPFQIVAEQAGFALRLDRRFTSKFAAYIKGGLEADHIKSLRDREYGEGGVSVTWVDDKDGDLQRRLLVTDLALRGAYDDRFQWFPTFAQLGSVTLVAPRFGFTFRYALSKDVIFTENAEVITNVYGDSRVLMNTTTNIGARVSSSLAITAGFELHYDSAPAAGRLSADSALTLGLELSM